MEQKKIYGRRNSKGFTLIEVILGLGIFSVVALSIYSTFYSGIKVNRQSTFINKINREVRWALESIGNDLENIISYNFEGSYEDAQSFEGDSAHVSFLMPSPEGLKRVSYYLRAPERGSVKKTIIGAVTAKNVSITTGVVENAETTMQLVREEESIVDALQSNSKDLGDVEILSRNVKPGSLKFLYAYKEDSEGNEQIIWKDSWPEKFAPFGMIVEATFIISEKENSDFTLVRKIFIPTGFWGKEQQ